MLWNATENAAMGQKMRLCVRLVVQPRPPITVSSHIETIPSVSTSSHIRPLLRDESGQLLETKRAKRGSGVWGPAASDKALLVLVLLFLVAKARWSEETRYARSRVVI